MMFSVLMSVSAHFVPLSVCGGSFSSEEGHPVLSPNMIKCVMFVVQKNPQLFLFLATDIKEFKAFVLIRSNYLNQGLEPHGAV